MPDGQFGGSPDGNEANLTRRETADANTSPSPQYRLPYHHMVQCGYYMLRGSPRNLGDDFRSLIPHLPAGPRVKGVEHLSVGGPLVIVGNHYQRPGLWLGWTAMIAGRAVFEHTKRSVRWVAISEWDNYRLFGVVIPNALTRAIFGRFQRTFGFITMAPTNAPTQERARSVRAALEAVGTGAIVGIFPEGDIGPTPALIPARLGTGLFLTALQSRKARIIPLGVSEERGTLNVVFGPPVDLSEVRALPRPQQDEMARTLAMTAVARLLPIELRGAYGV